MELVAFIEKTGWLRADQVSSELQDARTTLGALVGDAQWYADGHGTGQQALLSQLTAKGLVDDLERADSESSRATWVAGAVVALRYTDPVEAEGYGMRCRFDRLSQVYEFEYVDENSRVWWLDQATADQMIAQPQQPAPQPQPEPAVPAPAPAPAPAPEWDEQWRTFRRLSPQNTWEFCEAKVPGDRSSGPDDNWATPEVIAQRRTPPPQPVAPAQTPAPEAAAAQLAAPQQATEAQTVSAAAVVDAIAGPALAQLRASVDLGDMDPDQLNELLAKVVVDRIAAARGTQQ